MCAVTRFLDRFPWLWLWWWWRRRRRRQRHGICFHHILMSTDWFIFTNASISFHYTNAYSKSTAHVVARWPKQPEYVKYWNTQWPMYLRTWGCHRWVLMEDPEGFKMPTCSQTIIHWWVSEMIKTGGYISQLYNTWYIFSVSACPNQNHLFSSPPFFG